MAQKGNFDSQTNPDASHKGSHLTFLTPGRKVPHLKTTLTKPQNVFLENISPLYRQTVSPNFPHLSDVFTSPLVSTRSRTQLNAETLHYETANDLKQLNTKAPDGNSHEEHFDMTDASAAETQLKNVNKTIKQTSPNGTADPNRRGPRESYFEDHFDKINVAEIEAQIIPKNFLSATEAEQSPTYTSDVLSGFKSLSLTDASEKQSKETVQEESQRQDNCVNGNQNKGILQEGRRRRYTPSFCSSCSCDDSVIAHSRCSVCDGCSSSTCTSLFSHPEPAQVGSSGDCMDSCLQPLEMSGTKIDKLLDSHLSFDDLDAGLLKPHVEDGDRLRTNDKPNKLSLSTEQLVFLLLRMVLSKYKQMSDDLTVEKKTSKSQRQSLAYLIQAVLLLSRRVKVTSEQWRKTQLQLNLIQKEHERLRKHHRKIYIILCVLLVLNICRIQAVKQRVMRIVKFFGFVENMRKMNRLRKMIAENWRNIPSLLTDFWRIFIFRSTNRLKST